ncbi:MAG: hypothetical protein JWM64_2567, partial [Frankiales bacterium]|nr:hypothetical protein [Frankiales bacterium]
VRAARVDLASPSPGRRAVVWRSGALAGGIRSRTLRLVVVGTPGRPRVQLDAVAVVR